MALTSGFFNSVNSDRKYNAEQMSAIFDGIIVDGVFATVGNCLATIPGDGLQVIVRSGKAWFDHTWTVNDSDYPLDISTASTSYSRIDAVVLEVNNETSVRKNSLKVISGTASSSPVKPTLADTDNVHQYPLAYVTVPANATSISASNITNCITSGETATVSGPLSGGTLTDFFSGWEAEFDTWFANLQAQLTDNVATNLQNQIDEINENAETQNGTYVWEVASGEGMGYLSPQRMKTVYYAGTSSSITNTSSTHSLSFTRAYSTNAITYEKGLYSNLVYNGSLWTFSSVIASGTLPTSASTSVSLSSDDQCIILTTSYETLLVKGCSGIITYIVEYLNGSYYYPLALTSSSTYVSNSNYMVSAFSLNPALYIRSSTTISYLTSNSSSAYSESWTDNFNRTTLLGTISSMRKTVTAIVVPTASNTITVTFNERPRIFFFNTTLYMVNADHVPGSFICDTSTLNVQFYSYISEDYTNYSVFGIKITSSGHRTFTISETYSSNVLCRTGYPLVITGIM